MGTGSCTSSFDRRKDSVVFHIHNSNKDGAEQEKDPLHLTSNKKATTKAKRCGRTKKDYLDDSSDSDHDSPGSIGFFWRDWKIDEVFLETFANKMERLVRKWTNDNEPPISEVFALIKEKQGSRS